ncbi:MAG TPA: phosphotransferase [Gaiellaceae bacterium]|jgi:thiamine kinase-like enzyme
MSVTEPGARVEDVIARVPEWSGREVTHELMKGGLSHRIYLVDVESERFVLRILNRAVEDALLGIPAEEEIENTARAAETGVSPAARAVLPDVPAIVLDYVEGETLSVATVQDEQNIPRIGAACRRLHELSRPFVNDFDIFRHQERFLALCRREGLRIPDGYESYAPTLARIEEALRARRPPDVPCHNDLLAENFIDDGQAIWIVDYQLSGNHDPLFELGDIGAESDYDPDQVARLVEGYFGAETTPSLVARARLYLTVSNYTWTLWFSVHNGLLSNPDVDFDYWAEANDKWGQAVRDLESPELSPLLELAIQA